MTRIGIIADDLTGAAEVAALAGGLGFVAEVALEASQASAQAEVVVVDTDSRHLPPEAAMAAVARARARLRALGADRLCKKTDSTLRGNIARELLALLADEPERPLVYLPAHPRAGRSCVGGHLLLDGVPVEHTPLGADPLAPVSDGHLPSLLRAGGLLVHHVDRDSLRRDEWSPTIHAVTVVDGQDEVDLALALRRLRPLDATLVAPGAPLAMLLEGLAPAVRHEHAVDLVPGQLVVVGSRHPASLAQLRQLLAADACGIGLSPGRAVACRGDDERWLDQQAARARTALAEGRVVVLHTLVESADLEAYRSAARIAGRERDLPQRVTARLAEVAAGLVARLDPPGITVLGGATCRALCQRLGVVALRAHHAPAPGLALCTARDADGRRRQLVTKNGAFGAPELLEGLLCCSA